MTKPLSSTYADTIFNPIEVIILTITKNCNLNCRYCIAKAVPKNQRKMGFDTAKAIIDKIFDFPQKQFSIQFYGGEPFTNFDLMKKVVDYCGGKSGTSHKFCRFLLQSNGTLLDRNTVLFLKRHNVSIGISLDGPSYIHDSVRISNNGKSSHAQIMKGIDFLKKFDIPFNLIVTLTKINVQKPEEVLNEVKRLNANEFKLNPVFRMGKATESSELWINSEEYLSFTKSVINFIEREKGRILERNLTNIFSNIISASSERYMCQRAPCGAGVGMLAFDVDGDLYPCDGFMSSKQNRIVTMDELKNDNLVRIRANSRLIEKLSKRSFKNIGGCETCQWHLFCGFGCTSESENVFNDIYHKPLFCEYYKHLFPYLFEKIAENPHIVRYSLGRNMDQKESNRLKETIKRLDIV